MKFIHLFFFTTFLFSLETFCQVDSMRTQLHKETNEEKKIDLLLRIADVYIIIDVDSALYYCDCASDLIKENDKYMKQQIEILILRSEMFCMNGDFTKAIQYADRSKELIGLINSKSIAAHSKLAFSNIYIALSFYDLAYQECMSALKTFIDTKNLAGQRKCYTYLGSLSIGRNKYNEAQGYFEKAMNIAKELDDKTLLACSYNNIGNIYALQGDNKKALESYQYSSRISEQHKLHLLLLVSDINFALFYNRQKMYDQSLEYSSKGVQLATRYKNWRNLAQALGVHGQNYLEKGDYVNALPYALRADSINKALNMLDNQIFSSLLLSDLYNKTGQTELAFQYFKWYDACKDSLYQRQNEANLQKIHFEYQFKEQLDKQYRNTARNKKIIFSLLALSLLGMSYFMIQAKKDRNLIRNIKCDLDHKKREITSKLMHIQKKNEAITSVADKLKEAKYLFTDSPSTTLINHTIKELCLNSKNDVWEEFELRFEEVDPGFFKKLSSVFPKLTPYDKRLCAYLKLNMSSKEIASLLNLSINGVLSARYRLRKKLNLNKTDTEISAFLQSL